MLTHPQLIGYSQLTIERFTDYIIPDMQFIFNGLGSKIENVIEYAGRLCYRSTPSMGEAPDFIAVRLREGHADIIEHGWLSLRARTLDELALYRRNRYLVADRLNDGTYLVSGNFRAWRDTFHDDEVVMSEAALVAPQIFKPEAEGFYLFNAPAIAPRQVEITIKDKTYPSPAKVALLALHSPNVLYRNIMHHDILDDFPLDRRALHQSATFLIDGVSRTCTHQLVRSRLASISQESQRYVELEKGGWEAVIPPAIQDKDSTMDIIEEHWRRSEAAYAALRSEGIRKEDARFLLPNAASTRLVVTMPMNGWLHFLEQRDHKAAQWEIRAVAKTIKAMLIEAGLL